MYHFKILVPAAAAGRFIGKGGTTIAQLQKDAGVRVKMSKASEFYPGTTERVCLISGPIEGILKINDFFMENFSSTSIKIIVPNSTAGMIIGKGGNYIKQIKEESGAYVQISQKCTNDSMSSLPERCVTIVGELENIRKACAMILSKIVEDAGSSQASNSNSPQPSSSTTPAPTTTTTTTTTTYYSATSNNCTLNKNANLSSSNPTQSQHTTTALYSAAAATTNNNINNHHHSTNNVLPDHQIIESIKLVLRVSGYGEDAVSEITSAMSTLASYGVLGVGLGLI